MTTVDERLAILVQLAGGVDQRATIELDDAAWIVRCGLAHGRDGLLISAVDKAIASVGGEPAARALAPSKPAPYAAKPFADSPVAAWATSDADALGQALGETVRPLRKPTTPSTRIARKKKPT